MLGRLGICTLALVGLSVSACDDASNDDPFRKPKARSFAGLACVPIAQARVALGTSTETYLSRRWLAVMGSDVDKALPEAAKAVELDDRWNDLQVALRELQDGIFERKTSAVQVAYTKVREQCDHRVPERFGK